MTMKKELGCLHVLLGYTLGYLLYGGGLWVAAAYLIQGAPFEKQPLIGLIGSLLSVIGLLAVVMLPAILNGFDRPTRNDNKQEK